MIRAYDARMTDTDPQATSDTPAQSETPPESVPDTTTTPDAAPESAVPDAASEPITGTGDPSGVDAPGPAGPSVTQSPVEGDLRVSFTVKNETEEFPAEIHVTGTDDVDEARRFVIVAVSDAHPDVEVLNVTVDVVSTATPTTIEGQTIDTDPDAEPDPSV